MWWSSETRETACHAWTARGLFRDGQCTIIEDGEIDTARYLGLLDDIVLLVKREPIPWNVRGRSTANNADIVVVRGTDADVAFKIAGSDAHNPVIDGITLCLMTATGLLDEWRRPAPPPPSTWRKRRPR